MVIAAADGGDLEGDLKGLNGVVAIGASAGGVEALSNLAAGLSPDVPFAYLMALHVPADAPSILARIIDRSGPLPAVTAQDARRWSRDTSMSGFPIATCSSPTITSCCPRGPPRTGIGRRSTRCSGRSP